MPRNRRSVVASAAVTAVFAVAAVTGCAPGLTGTPAPGPSAAAAPPAVSRSPATANPSEVSAQERWRAGGWKKWDHWARAAAAFANPFIKDLWSPSRMGAATEVTDPVPQGAGAGETVTDPAPAAAPARPMATPYHSYASPVGKVFFDSPRGPMVCSGTVVEDPAHPGKSDLVWTAGHCVHGGAKGGWYRNIAFVPAYNDRGLSAGRLAGAPASEAAPYGVWWADWAQTSDQWISTGATSGGSGSPYDYAVLHVTPEDNDGKSLEETVGAALPVWFDAPPANALPTVGAWGYPAAAPYDGQQMFDCVDRPARLSLDAGAPTEYRIGCTMTGGSSGGGWFAKEPGGKVALVSDTSIGPRDSAWLAGPYLGPVAKGVYQAMVDRFADR